MLEPKGTLVEVWGVTADDEGIVLLERDAWRSRDVIRSGHRSYDEAKWLVRDAGDVPVLHSTSWRDDGDAFVHTYIAVVRVGDYAETVWPDAQPVRAELFRHVGKPAQVGAAEEPQPMYLHVLEHALRHLSWLSRNDSAVADELGEAWHRHLASIEPKLATMFMAA